MKLDLKNIAATIVGILIIVAHGNTQEVQSTQRLDSLKAAFALDSDTDTSGLADIYRFVKSDMNAFMVKNPQGFVSFGNFFVSQAKRVGDPDYLARAYNIIGSAYNGVGKQDSSHILWEKALQSIGYDRQNRLYYVITGNRGMALSFEGELKGAYTILMQSLKDAEQAGLPDSVRATAFRGLFSVFYQLEDWPKALQYARLSYETNQTFKSKIADAYNLSYALFKNERYEEALGLLNEALIKAKNEEGMVIWRGILLNAIGQVYGELGEVTIADDYFERAIEELEEFPWSHVKAGILADAFEYYIKIGKEHKVEQLALDMQENLDMSSTPTYHKFMLQVLYANARRSGDVSSSIRYLEQIVEVTEQLKKEDVQKAVLREELAMRNATERRADSLDRVQELAEIKLSHAEEVGKLDQKRNLAIAFGGVILLIAGGLLFRIRVIKKAQSEVERERERSDVLLRNILPTEIASELKAEGVSQPRHIEQASVLFTDFQGFTSRAAEMNAHNLVAELNEYFSAFDDICVRYGVEKIKTIGDAYLAAGGVPHPKQRQARSTVLAALEMQRFVSSRQDSEVKGANGSIKMRIGIHSGPVIAGIVGSSKFQYDIWGDTVNTASRMESSGEVGKVNISQSTYDLIKDDPDFVFEKRGKIEAKGKGELEMWFVQFAHHSDNATLD